MKEEHLIDIRAEDVITTPRDKGVERALKRKATKEIINEKLKAISFLVREL